MCAAHHQQTTRASIWKAVDEFWLFCIPHTPLSAFLRVMVVVFFFFQAVWWLKTSCFPPKLHRKVIWPLNWAERETLTQLWLLAVRTTDETGRGLIGPACLLWKRKRAKRREEWRGEHSKSRKWTGTVMCYQHMKVNDDRGGFLWDEKWNGTERKWSATAFMQKTTNI